MAIIVKDGNEKIYSEVKLYTGVSKMNIVAICPTLQQLKDLGFGFKEEPVYTSTADDNTQKVRIDIVFKNDSLKGKATFFLENRDRVEGKSGFEWIDNYGNSTWAPTIEDARVKTFDSGKLCLKDEGIRRSKVGEVELVQFIRDWCALNPDTDQIIIDLNQLFKGNYKELQDILKHPVAQTNQMYTLSYVTDGKYQQIYSRYFVRMQFSEATAMSKFKKHLATKTGPYALKGEYTLEFKEYVPSMIQPDVDVKFNELDNSDKLQF